MLLVHEDTGISLGATSRLPFWHVHTINTVVLSVGGRSVKMPNRLPLCAGPVGTKLCAEPLSLISTLHVGPTPGLTLTPTSTLWGV